MICNLLIIFMIEPLIKLVGINYQTTQRMLTSVAIFACLLLNSMVMPILLQANFSTDYPDSIWNFLFDATGRNSDLGAFWYSDITSQLTINLVLLSLMPVLIVAVEMIQVYLSRFIISR